MIPLGATAVTLLRFDGAASRGDDGRVVVPSPTTSTIQMSVQPLGKNEVRLLPEGERAADYRKGYTTSDVRALNQHDATLGDHIVHGGVTYVVMDVDYQQTVLPHNKATLRRLQEVAP